MVIEPKIRGFICTTAHPEGCRAHVREQIQYVKSLPHTQGAKKALIIGSSTGYGLASRIAAAYSCGAATLGVAYEKPASGSRTASAGWYNTAAFESFAREDGLWAESINGDAYSAALKEQAVQRIRQTLEQVDLVIYSLAAPRRTLADGTVVSSVIKTTEAPFTEKTVDLKTRAVTEITLEPATEQEIADTIQVMGGGDWKEWIRVLAEAGCLAKNAITLAYSYIGPALTHPMYLKGTIGRAKEDLFHCAQEITRAGQAAAYISVNKALVTQSSAAIPVVPLYISLLYRVMKDMRLHEGCIEQMYRLLHDKLYSSTPVVDEAGQLRLDDLEMREDVQAAVQALWARLDTEPAGVLGDIDGYWEDFYHLFGFGLPGVDYAAEQNPAVEIPSIGRE